MPDMPAKIYAVPSRMSSPAAGGYWRTSERGDGRSTPFVREDLAEEAIDAAVELNDFNPNPSPEELLQLEALQDRFNMAVIAYAKATSDG